MAASPIKGGACVASAPSGLCVDGGEGAVGGTDDIRRDEANALGYAGVVG